MKKLHLLLFVALSFASVANAQEADEPGLAGNETVEHELTEKESTETKDASAAEESLATGSIRTEESLLAEEAPTGKKGGPKTMSGMSILGNEETPKSLVIVPWKSSEMGDELDLSDTLDERARPVDKEVFLREVKFYQIRSGEQ